RAADGDLARGQLVRRMAAGAARRSVAPCRMMRLLGVAARARLRRGRIVLRVATEAAAVPGRRKDVLLAVAAGARARLGLVELMRRVAAGAGGVADGDRAVVDLDLAALARMAGRAVLIGKRVGLVHLMAVEAAARAGVVVLFVGVAARARLRIEHRRGVRAM